MSPQIGEYYYLLGTSEFGKLVGFLKTKPKKNLPKTLLKKYEEGKYVVLAMSDTVGREDDSDNFTVMKNEDFESLFGEKKLRCLPLEDLKRIFPVAEDPEANLSQAG